MATYTFQAGRLLCKTIRNFLQGEQFKGRAITFLESEGMLERQFIVKGNDDDVIYIMRCLENWARQM